MNQKEEMEIMKKLLVVQIRNNIRDNSDDGICSRCGQCGSNLLPMNMEDVDRIRQYLKTHDISPAPKERPATLYYRVDFDPCPFCDFTGGFATCKIFEVAPTICKKFICKAELLAEQYDINGDIVQDKIGQVDCRKTFFGDKP